MHTVLLACDACGAHRQGRMGGTVEDLRFQLVAVGWVCDPVHDRDLCPACQPATSAAPVSPVTR